MAFFRNHYDCIQLIEILWMLKTYHDAGIYDVVVRGTETITEDDYYEFSDLGLENAAPLTTRKEFIYDNESDEWIAMRNLDNFDGYEEEYPHNFYTYSSPEMREYCRLCRLYEYREGIPPEQNPYHRRAHTHAAMYMRRVGNVWIGFTDDDSGNEMYVETSSEMGYDAAEVVNCIHHVMAYYRENLNALRLELLRGPWVFLPALPAAKGAQDG